MSPQDPISHRSESRLHENPSSAPPANDRPGDRWMCGRAHTSHACASGPNAKGQCPLTDACRVKRTWQGRRKQISLVATVIITAGLCFMTQSRFNTMIMKPGDLATPHAQILSGTLDSQRCAACHPQADGADQSWMNTSAKGHPEISQTDRCLDCHHGSIERNRAKFAHNLSAESFVKIRLARQRFAAQRSFNRTWHDMLPGPAVKQDDIECATCHREHQGSAGDLLAISDQQCQTCHSDRFGSFASSHPDWHQWPYGRGGSISFNHATHANLHFPKSKQRTTTISFDCVSCHERTADNELRRSVSYRQACQSCHDASLKLEAAEGLNLLALPTIPQESASELLNWPERATGFFDGSVTPLAELLLRHDPEMAAAFRKIPSRDFSRIQPNATDSVAAATTIAKGHRKLLHAMAKEGQNTFLERSQQLGLPVHQIAPLLQSLAPQLIRQAAESWFQANSAGKPNSAQNSSPIRQMQFQRAVKSQQSLLDDQPSSSQGPMASDSLLSEPLLSEPLLSEPLLDDLPLKNAPLLNDSLLNDSLLNDSLWSDPLSQRNSGITANPSFDAEAMLPVGGWYRDDGALAIRYRAGRHDDPVLKATIELANRLSPGDPVRERLLVTRAVAACISCHPGAMEAGGTWRSEPLIGRRSQFTKFSHGSHLHIAQLADCQHCHRVESPSHSTSLGIEQINFTPLERDACVGCHTPHAAGDSCTKCHRYHIDPR